MRRDLELRRPLCPETTCRTTFLPFRPSNLGRTACRCKNRCLGQLFRGVSCIASFLLWRGSSAPICDCGECLALDSGIDRTYVSRLERALENPTVAVLSRVAVALQVDIRDLLDPKPLSRGPVAPLRSGRKKRSKTGSRS